MLSVLPPRLQQPVLRFYRTSGAAVLDRLLSAGYRRKYQNWIKQYDSISTADRAGIWAEIMQLADPPLISILMPVFNTPEAYLRAAIESVLAQVYPYWELCVADDASTHAQSARLLAEYARRESRIKIAWRTENGGISASSNSALALATGSFVALLDHDDILPPHALYLIAREIPQNPDLDLIYSDEDKLDRRGRRTDPYFKSDWNPDLFLGQNMISHFGAYRTSLVREVGGFRSEFDGSQDYDLALRVLERSSAARIHHVPHVLYHWRQAKGSAARRPDEKPYARLAAKRAVAEHLRRVGVSAAVEFTPGPVFHEVRRTLEGEPTLAIIIPTRDRRDLLSRCVSGLLSATDYRKLELVIVDNLSTEPAALSYLEEVGADPRVRILRYPHPFNFSRINNWAAAQSQADILLFLNNDTEVIHHDWLQHMAANALRPEVGAVGAKLLYPNGRVQHGGIILGMGGVGGHFHLRRRDDDPGYFGRAQLQQNLSAVTAACLAIRHEVFDEIGGFDAENLPVAFNDVDLCLRVRERGYLVVWTPLARLYHHETASRAFDLVGDRSKQFACERAYMRSRWGPVLDDDPYFNPNLSLDDVTIALALPPRRPYPWRSTAASTGEAERCS